MIYERIYSVTNKLVLRLVNRLDSTASPSSMGIRGAAGVGSPDTTSGEEEEIGQQMLLHS
jgi:hypothetical protein